MKNLLKTVLPVIAIFSAFSLNNTYSQDEDDVIDIEMGNAVDGINQHIEEMKQIGRELRNYVDRNQYNNMELQIIEDRLQEIQGITSALWELKKHITDLQKYYGRNLNARASRLFQQYIGKYFDIVNLLKEAL